MLLAIPSGQTRSRFRSPVPDRSHARTLLPLARWCLSERRYRRAGARKSSAPGRKSSRPAKTQTPDRWSGVPGVAMIPAKP